MEPLDGGYHAAVAVGSPSRRQLPRALALLEWRNTVVTRRTGNSQCPIGGPPDDLFVSYSSVTRTQLEQFEVLLDKNSSETGLDKFLRDNLSVLVNSLKVLKTGYDGAWIISKQHIQASMSSIQNGLIPDFIVGGCNSCCFSWFVLHLDGAHQKILTEDNNFLYFNSTVNMAIGQVIEYIDYCAAANSFLRNSLCLTDFREPKGLIIVGRESEFSDDPRREKFKSTWNRLMGHKIELMTYDAILRYVRSEVEFKENRL
ncbi:MAG TPA: hypothetical protein DCE18_05005 [Syntrophobacteraceae bacterium]|jgi:hypothetical protein|nr:hypothetical protein [Syntrophobacteraceae bacterium]